MSPEPSLLISLPTSCSFQPCPKYSKEIVSCGDLLSQLMKICMSSLEKTTCVAVTSSETLAILKESHGVCLIKAVIFLTCSGPGPLKENAGRHLATGRSQTLERRAVLVLAAGDALLPPSLVNCHISLFDPPRVLTVPKSLLHVLAVSENCQRKCSGR